MTTVAKAAVALFVGVAGWCAQVTQSPRDAITTSEWVALVSVVVTAFLVWLVPNTQKGPAE